MSPDILDPRTEETIRVAMEDVKEKMAALDYYRHIKAQIRKGKLPRYVFTKDFENDCRLERQSKPDSRYVGGVGLKKLTWGLKSTLHQLTKK